MCLGRACHHISLSKWTALNGAYPVLVALNRARMAGTPEAANDLALRYDGLVKATVYGSLGKGEPPHPDFLRDCVTIAKAA